MYIVEPISKERVLEEYFNKNKILPFFKKNNNQYFVIYYINNENEIGITTVDPSTYIKKINKNWLPILKETYTPSNNYKFWFKEEFNNNSFEIAKKVYEIGFTKILNVIKKSFTVHPCLKENNYVSFMGSKSKIKRIGAATKSSILQDSSFLNTDSLLILEMKKKIQGLKMTKVNCELLSYYYHYLLTINNNNLVVIKLKDLLQEIYKSYTLAITLPIKDLPTLLRLQPKSWKETASHSTYTRYDLWLELNNLFLQLKENKKFEEVYYIQEKIGKLFEWKTLPIFAQPKL